MLRIVGDEAAKSNVPSFSYARPKGLLGTLIIPLTRWLRAINAERYMKPARRHLDIGCGDGYFLRRSKCKERFGLDRLWGDEVKDKLNFSDNYFDYVTLLAVIEHIGSPQKLISEIARVLKPNGILIITTPLKTAEGLMKMYAKEIETNHVFYCDLPKMEDLVKQDFVIQDYHRFLFGFNQIFYMIKLSRDKMGSAT
ncbi:MAG: class I SAM-dependent methyltransferase [Candidatus Omnitrophota bacterium]